MTKIKNTGVYIKETEPTLSDFLVGTKDSNGKTKSFSLEAILQLLNSSNGVNNIQFKFSNGLHPTIDFLSAGYFFTDTNTTEVGTFTELIFNKETIQPLDLSPLFNKLGELEDVVIKLENPEDPNNFFNFKVVSFTDNTDYFTFGIEDFNELYIGVFENGKIYSFYFDILSESNFYISGTSMDAEGVKTGSITKKGELVIDSEVDNVSGLVLEKIQNLVVTDYTIITPDTGENESYIHPIGCMGNDDFYYVPMYPGIIKVNITTGVIEDFSTFIGEPTAVCLGLDGFLYALASTTIYKINHTTGEVVSTVYSGILLSNAHCLVYATDNNIYIGYIVSNEGLGRLTLAGDLTIFPTVDGHCQYIDQGVDGLLYCNTGSRIYKATLDGVISDFINLPTTLSLYCATDGFIYTHRYGLGILYKITYSGTIEELPVALGEVIRAIDQSQNGTFYFNSENVVGKLSLPSNKVLKTDENGNVIKTTYLEDVQYLVPTDILGKEDKINKGVANGYAGLDSDGFVPLSQTNPSVLGRLVVVADQTARFALTLAIVQNGDTVKQSDTGIMYYVKDDTNLSNSSGYELYRAGTAASVPWTGVTGTPTSISGYGIIPASGDYTTALVTETTDKNYQTDIQKLYNDATSSIQTQLNNRALVSQLNTNSITNNSLVTGGTTTDALNTLNTGLVYKKTIAQIRALSGTLPSNNFYTTDINKEGNWYYDSTDVISADNTGTVLVTADGKRIKRIFNTLSVKYFGAKGDETTDDTTPVFNALGVSKTTGIPLFFPKGTYYISHIGASAAFSSSTICSDKETILSVLDAPNVSTTVDALNPIKVKLRFLNSEVWLTPKNKENVNEKSQSISTKDAKFQKNNLLDFTTLSYKSITWPGSDVYANHIPSSVSASQVQLIGTLGSYTLGLAPAEVGKSSTIQFKSASGELIVYIRTTTGSHGVSVGLGDAATPAEFHKSLGVSGTSSLFSYPGLGTHGSYSFFKSNITIRTMSKNSYSVMLNGLVVQNNVKVSGEILEVGFGVSNVGTVVITDWVDSFSDIDEGKSIVKLAIFGDSRTDDSEYMNWPDYTKKYLDGVAGIRVHEIYNYAVSGQAIAQQKLLCTPENIANANVVVIDIGTNDIQLITNEDTFATDLETMIDVCLTAKKRVIIGVPDLFYTQGQAGSRGQGSINYDRHKGIRAKCMSIAAKKGVYFIDKGQILGPILAQYVNPSISGSYVSLGLDPILYDNIHPTTYGRMILGREYAKSIMAVLMEKIDYATVAKLDLKADLVSPTLTGDPKAPTATAGTNTTQIATTAFVTNAVSTGASSGTYTLSFSSLTNISSPSDGLVSSYIKVGNIVTVMITLSCTVTVANTLSAISVNLPIARANVTGAVQIGSCSIQDTAQTTQGSAGIVSSTATNTVILSLNPLLSGSSRLTAHITYNVLQ